MHNRNAQLKNAGPYENVRCNKYRHNLAQAGWFLRPDCAPSSECLPSFDRCTPVLLVDCCCTLVLHSASSERIPFDRRGFAGMANLSPPSVLFESSRTYLQYTGDTDAKNDGLEF